jgi:hypothetical protein
MALFISSISKCSNNPLVSPVTHSHIAKLINMLHINHLKNSPSTIIIACQAPFQNMPFGYQSSAGVHPNAPEPNTFWPQNPNNFNSSRMSLSINFSGPTRNNPAGPAGTVNHCENLSETLCSSEAFVVDPSKTICTLSGENINHGPISVTRFEDSNGLNLVPTDFVHNENELPPTLVSVRITKEWEKKGNLSPTGWTAPTHKAPRILSKARFESEGIILLTHITNTTILVVKCCHCANYKLHWI